MKKTTLLILLFCISFIQLNAQLSEDFEGAFPPADWSIADNGIGTTINWESSTDFFSGAKAAFIDYDGTGTTEDWLISPQFTPDASNNILTFFQKQDDAINYGSSYTVRVKNITDVVDFVTVDTQLETDFGVDYSLHTVDLSSYNGKIIQIAFVLSQFNGDSWYVDTISTVNPTMDVPICADSPSPSIAEMDVINLAQEVFLSWDAPGSGVAPTSYIINAGTNSGSLDFKAEVGNTNYTLTEVPYGTTYYWEVVPQNYTVSANSCVEWSFTTGVSPGVPSNDSCETAIAISVTPYENTQDAIYATNNYPLDNGFVWACDGGSPVGGMNDGVWYTFTTILGGNLTIDITDVSSAFNVEVAVYSGSCGSLICVGNKDTAATGDGASESLSVVVDNATQYWINIGDHGASSPDVPEGAFKITLSVSGGTTLSNDKVIEQLEVNLYPNPTTGMFTINSKDKIEEIRIFNLLGQEVLKETSDKRRVQIDASRLTKGIYIVDVRSETSKGTYRIIKQ